MHTYILLNVRIWAYPPTASGTCRATCHTYIWKFLNAATDRSSRIHYRAGFAAWHTACSVGWFVSLLVREEVLLTGLCEKKILFRLKIYDRLRQATPKQTECPCDGWSGSTRILEPSGSKTQRPRLDCKFLQSEHCSTFRLYLINFVRSWTN